MEICVVGTGYVGLVLGACMADFGHHVTCVDRDESKIAVLENGGVPIYEPGLDDIIERTTKTGHLRFTTQLAVGLEKAEVAYIAVGTPPSADGSANLSGVLAVAEAIGTEMRRPTTVITKSTVPVGTADKVRERVGRNARFAFDVVSNPEFLAEGNAIRDFTHPDRIVVGFAKPKTKQVIEKLYKPLVILGRPIYFMDNRSAELTKYAANAMLATRISFMNDIANLCDAVGADVDMVRKGVGSDSRIGRPFLYAGCGYGGSCFPKDVQALMHTAKEHGTRLRVVEAVEAVNQDQKHLLFAKLTSAFGGDLAGKRVALWGLAFKARTDDIRESPALVFADEALRAGVDLVCYDPEANETAQQEMEGRLTLADDQESALDGAVALVIATDWNQFKNPGFEEVKSRMAGNVIIDGRNLYDPSEVAEAGFRYYCIGRPTT